MGADVGQYSPLSVLFVRHLSVRQRSLLHLSAVPPGELFPQQCITNVVIFIVLLCESYLGQKHP